MENFFAKESHRLLERLIFNSLISNMKAENKEDPQSRFVKTVLHAYYIVVPLR